MVNSTSTKTALFCVVYRTGGTDNFKWVRTLAMSKNEANACKVSTEKMGYRAMVANYAQSIAIGLPETYE